MIHSLKKASRLLALSLALLLALSLLSGCKSHPLTPSGDATRAVGTVGDYSVPYEELYFLASSYDNEEMSEGELWDTVSENIIANYAILTLCDRADVEISEDELDDAVQAYIDSVIESDFGGDRSEYVDALGESGMTDHYVRFTAKVDLLYSELATALAKSGDILGDEDDIINHIKSSFVRTRHFMVANNDGDDRSENLAIAQNALSELREGKTNMHKLIGGKYNEDLLIPADGYAFPRGYMEKPYEDAAFALEVGQFSEVVTAMGELASGEYVECFYVIERLPIDDAFINAQFSTLYESYTSSVVAQKLDEVKAELSFEPNSYAQMLNIKDLEPVSAGTDTFTIIVVTVCVVCVAAVALIIVFAVRYHKKKKNVLLAEKAKKAALRSGKAQ